MLTPGTLFCRLERTSINLSITQEVWSGPGEIFRRLYMDSDRFTSLPPSAGGIVGIMVPGEEFQIEATIENGLIGYAIVCYFNDIGEYVGFTNQVEMFADFTRLPLMKIG